MRKEHKLLKRVYGILKGVLTVFLVLVLLVVAIQKITNNNLAIGGVRVFVIVSDSMMTDYMTGDILVAKEVNPSSIKIGDRITYVGEEQELRGKIITHEVIERRTENGKYYFITKGIANEFADPEITEDAIYGKIVYKTILFSLLGRVMTNLTAYYALFIVVGLIISIEFVRSFFLKKDNDEETAEKKLEEVIEEKEITETMDISQNIVGTENVHGESNDVVAQNAEEIHKEEEVKEEKDDSQNIAVTEMVSGDSSEVVAQNADGILKEEVADNE